MKDSHLKIISDNLNGSFLVGEPLSNHTTYRVGGKADCLVCPESSESAAWVFEYAKRESLPLAIIGAGSNVIAPDEGIAGIVLKLRSPSAAVSFPGGRTVIADAGAALIDLARAAAEKGLRGFEPIAGIPGTVGGAVFMNAGTKDGDTAGLLEEVEVMTGVGKRRAFSPGELAFGYRTSAFQKTGWLILRAVFSLDEGDPGEIRGEIDRIFAERQEKYPLDEPNAGSVFKRPSGDYAGRLLEEAGCKGLKVGGASVSTRHANFIVNDGDATAADIVGLISLMRRRVYDMSGICLELENEIMDSFR